MDKWPWAFERSLQGIAKDVAHNIPREVLDQGGVIDGQFLNPLAFLLKTMETQFGRYEDELQLHAAHEFRTFRKRDHEHIDASLTRYERLRVKAETEANHAQTYESYSYDLFDHARILTQERLQLLQPLNNKWPNNADEYHAFLARMRR